MEEGNIAAVRPSSNSTKDLLHSSLIRLTKGAKGPDVTGWACDVTRLAPSLRYQVTRVTMTFVPSLTYITDTLRHIHDIV